LEYLVRRIKDDLGAKDIKKYLPHVTIARWKIPSKQQYFLIKKKLQAMRIDLSFTVDHLFLYQSVSHKHHPVYKKLRQFDLQ
jgi:2'-5' RNA ligase